MQIRTEATSTDPGGEADAVGMRQLGDRPGKQNDTDIRKGGVDYVEALTCIEIGFLSCYMTCELTQYRNHYKEVQR